MSAIETGIVTGVVTTMIVALVFERNKRAEFIQFLKEAAGFGGKVVKKAIGAIRSLL